MQPETAKALWEVLSRASEGYKAHVKRKREEAESNPPAPGEFPEVEVAPEAIDLLEAQVATSAQLVDVTVDAISAIESAKAEVRALRLEIGGLRGQAHDLRGAADDIAASLAILAEEAESG
jgi:hypothetical protein